MREKFKYIIISLPFMAILFFLFINQSIGLIVEKNNIENRKKIEKPKMDISHLDNFPNLYNDYYQDNFHLRDRFLSFYNSLNKNVFKNPILSKKFISGKDDFIFAFRRFKKERKSFSNEHMKMIKQELQKRDSVFQSFGTEMYVFFIPCKSNLYHEKLPAFFSDIKTDRSESLVKYLQDNSTLKVFSMRDYLDEKSDTSSLFLKYDTHWNKLGAFWGYKFITSILSKDFPNIHTYSIDDFKIKNTIKKDGGIANNLGLKLHDKQFSFKSLFKKEYKLVKTKKKYKTKEFFPYGVKTVKNQNDSLAKAIVIHDSFTPIMSQFIFPTFSEGLFLWDKWNYKPHYNLVKDYQPDMIIYILVEINSEKFLPENLQDVYDVKF